MSLTGVPPPPAPFPEPVIEVWPAGKPITRCHNSEWGSTEFNDGLAVRRFRPFTTKSGRVIGTMYGADTDNGALSETVFHDVPVRGTDRAVDVSRFNPWALSRVIPHRDLRLAKLRGTGLRRLQVTHAELIESTASRYAETIPWAEALWGHAARLDGLIWMSRQHNESAALMLFGRQSGRGVERGDLAPDPSQPLETIASGRGLERVLRFADEAGIEVRGI